MTDNVIDLADERERREREHAELMEHFERMNRHRRMRPFGTTFWCVGRWVCQREQWLREKKEVALQWATNEE